MLHLCGGGIYVYGGVHFSLRFVFAAILFVYSSFLVLLLRFGFFRRCMDEAEEDEEKEGR